MQRERELIKSGLGLGLDLTGGMALHDGYLTLVKCYDNNKVKSPHNWVNSPLTQPLVTNQQKKTR